MKKILQNSLMVIAAVVFVEGAFLVASGSVTVNGNSLLSMVLGSFWTNPTVTIVKNVSSPTGGPSGRIIPGINQPLAVFDVKSYASEAHITTLPVSVNITGDGVSITNFSLTYQSCLPRYMGPAISYGYGGLNCKTYNVLPISSTRVGQVYILTFTPNWSVLGNQTLGVLTLNGTPYYTGYVYDPSNANNAGVRASITSGAVMSAVQCRNINGTGSNSYGYAKCYPVSTSINTSQAVGNLLLLSRSYGYGYSNVNKTTPSITSISPTSGNSGSGLITITGANFNSSSVVFFNHGFGIAVPASNVANTTSLTFMVPKGVTPGDWPISVANDGTTFSNNVNFNVTKGVTVTKEKEIQTGAIVK